MTLLLLAPCTLTPVLSVLASSPMVQNTTLPTVHCAMFMLTVSSRVSILRSNINIGRPMGFLSGIRRLSVRHGIASICMYISSNVSFSFSAQRPYKLPTVRPSTEI